MLHSLRKTITKQKITGLTNNSIVMYIIEFAILSTIYDLFTGNLDGNALRSGGRNWDRAS